MPSNRARPTSEIFFSTPAQPGSATTDTESVRVAEQWLADLEMYKTTLEDMASASVDKEFKDELEAIQQWFDVLSVSERTATLYALLQHTTQVQVRFFITVLQKMAKNDTLAGILSPTLDHEMESQIPGSSSSNSSANLPYPHIPGSHQRQQSLNSAYYQANGIYRAATPTNGRFPMALDPTQLLPYPPGASNHRHSQSQTLNQPYGPDLAAAAAAVGLQVPTLTGLSNSLISSNLPKQGSRKDFTPWTRTDEINRPKSADVTLGSSNVTGLAMNQSNLATLQALQNSNITASGMSNLSSQFKLLNPPPSQSVLASRYNTSSPPPSQLHQSTVSNIPQNSNPIGTAASNSTSSASVSNANNTSAASTATAYQPSTQQFANIPEDGHSSLFPTFLTPMDFSGRWSSAVNSPVSAAFSGTQDRFNVNSQIVNNTALKLAALSTVNSRVVLDNDVKKYRRNNRNDSRGNVSSSSPGGSNQRSASTDSNDNGSANFVRPVPIHPNHNSNLSNSNNNLRAPNVRSHSRSRSRETHTPTPDKFNFPGGSSPRTSGKSNHPASNSSPSLGTGSSSLSSKEAFIDRSLLEDISAWLKVLRLHKYTPVLSDLHWKELVALDEEQLEARGVSALGARRKMLKAFEQVKAAMENGELE